MLLAQFYRFRLALALSLFMATSFLKDVFHSPQDHDSTPLMTTWVAHCQHSGCTWACLRNRTEPILVRTLGRGRGSSKRWPDAFLAIKLQCVIELRDLQLEGWVTNAFLVIRNAGRQSQLPFPPAVVCVCTGRAQAMTRCS